MALAVIKRYSHIANRSDAQFIKQIVEDYMEYKELIEQIISKEKDDMRFPYENERYVENYSDHYWEASSSRGCDNWYIRYEFEYVESDIVPDAAVSEMIINLSDWAEEDLLCSDVLD